MIVHRLFRSGASSHDQVLRGADVAAPTGDTGALYSGLLCTVDVRSDPIAVYQALLAAGAAPDRLPAAARHLGRIRRGAGRATTPYADWLSRIYDRWRAGRPPGRGSGCSSRCCPRRRRPERQRVGRARPGRPGGDRDRRRVGAGRLPQDRVRRRPGHRAGRVPRTAPTRWPPPRMLARRRRGLAGLCATCRACPVVEQCGGGLFAHRYRTGSGFDNPERLLRRPQGADAPHERHRSRLRPDRRSTWTPTCCRRSCSTGWPPVPATPWRCAGWPTPSWTSPARCW